MAAGLVDRKASECPSGLQRGARDDGPCVKAQAGRLPTLSAFNQYIQTEGNGTPSGVFVANKKQRTV